MGTRSIIGLARDSGFEGRYCHWDGYPTARGAELFETYAELDRDWEKVREYAIRPGQKGYWSCYAKPSVHAEEEAKPTKVTCELCEGTGKRTDLEVHNGCNGCGGTGQGYNRNRLTTWQGENGDSWATEENDWGAEWAYLLSEAGIDVLRNRRSGWVRVVLVAWDNSEPDWGAIQEAGDSGLLLRREGVA